MAQRIWRIVRLTAERWSRNDGNTLAASMAYYAAFSFFPLLLVLISALGFALSISANAQNAEEQLLELLSQASSPALAKEVSSILSGILAGIQSRAAYGGPVGLVTLLFGAIGIFSQLESAFDRLWHAVTPHERGIWAAVRNALWNRLKAFLTLIGLGIAVMAAFVTELLMAGMRNWAGDVPGGNTLWEWSQATFSLALNALVLTLVYKMIPRAFVRWNHAAVGGLIVALVWQLGSQIVSRYVVAGNYSAYGVVGSFIAILLWVYCASMLLFFGGQLVQVLGHPYEDNGGPVVPPGRTKPSAPPPSKPRKRLH